MACSDDVMMTPAHAVALTLPLRLERDRRALALGGGEQDQTRLIWDIWGGEQLSDRLSLGLYARSRRCQALEHIKV
jgi:hypothetical protein